MHTADLVLAIAVPLVALGAGWAGVEMSLTPPDRLTPQQRRRYRAAFVLLVVAAIGLNIWQTARNAEQQDEAKNEFQKMQGQLSNKVSEQGGKLDAISHFEQQFLTFVSQQRPSSPDAATKAYEAMALTVMKMAQGSSLTSAQDVHLQILYEKSELDGRTILLPIANANIIALSEFHIKNVGTHETSTVTGRLYFSKEVGGGDLWEATASDEPNFPSAFFWGGPIVIHPQETWNWPAFRGQLASSWESNEPIMCRLKMFYGSERPAVANFVIRHLR